MYKYTCKITYVYNACIVSAIKTVVGVCIAVCRLLEYYFTVGHDTLLATRSEQNYKLATVRLLNLL